MPPAKKLSAEQIAVLDAIGSRWALPGPATPTSSAPVRKGEMQVTDKDRQHWSFQPVKRPSAAPRQK